MDVGVYLYCDFGCCCYYGWVGDDFVGSVVICGVDGFFGISDVNSSVYSVSVEIGIV